VVAVAPEVSLVEALQLMVVPLQAGWVVPA
jgi:hypothetical protein